MLMAVSPQQTHAVICYLKELTLHQTVYLTVTALCAVAAYKLKYSQFTLSGLVAGLNLIGVLLFSLSEARHRYGISTTTIVNVALMLTVSHPPT